MNSYMDQSIRGQFPITRLRIGFFQIGLILVILYVISLYDYLLFHALSEFIGASIAIGIFMLTWNSRKFFTNNYYLFIGMAFAVSGIISIIHALAYRGMGVIPGTATNANMATQLWLANQYILAITFVVAPFFLRRKLSAGTIFLGYLVALIFILLSIFDWKIFPVAYQEGLGLTAFKKISEYVVSFLFLLSIYFFYRKRALVNYRVLRLMSIVLILFAVSTWSFTLYVGVYDFFNMIGHLLRIMAFYVSYLAIVELSLMRPYQTIFKELDEKQLALKYEKDKLTSILDAMSDGIYITNADYKVLYVNPALVKNFGPTNGQKCYQYLQDRSTPCPWCKNKEIFEKKANQRWECYYPKCDKTFDLIDSPLVTPEGTITKMAIFRDITAKKKIEKAKDEFISLASHQLRTPLASIRLSSELMLRGVSGENSPEQKGFLEEINKATKKMGILVGNLLNVSRIEMGTFDVKAEAMDIGSTAKSIAGEFIALMAEKEIDYKISAVENAPIIYFDENVLHIIIENLLSNSLRYTPRGGKVSFNLKKQNFSFIIEVTDSGYGIIPDQKEQIFKKSFRTERAKSLSSEGSGLGLYMVKSICDKIGTKIWFESEPEARTTFYVSIPIENDPQ
jgi:hypothetical protein